MRPARRRSCVTRALNMDFAVAIRLTEKRLVLARSREQKHARLDLLANSSRWL